MTIIEIVKRCRALIPPDQLTDVADKALNSLAREDRLPRLDTLGQVLAEHADILLRDPAPVPVPQPGDVVAEAEADDGYRVVLRKPWGDAFLWNWYGAEEGHVYGGPFASIESALRDREQHRGWRITRYPPGWPQAERDSAAPEVTKLRHVVTTFALAMECVLRAHDHKGGWKDCSLEWLSDRIRDERNELLASLEAGDFSATAREAVDIANFAMMIWDNASQAEGSSAAPLDPLDADTHQDDHARAAPTLPRVVGNCVQCGTPHSAYEIWRGVVDGIDFRIVTGRGQDGPLGTLECGWWDEVKGYQWHRRAWEGTNAEQLNKVVLEMGQHIAALQDAQGVR